MIKSMPCNWQISGNLLLTALYMLNKVSALQHESGPICLTMTLAFPIHL